jgi:hypothetical protein
MANTGDFDIISAIAQKDASVEDIARHLRDQGISTIEDIVGSLRSAASAAEAAVLPSVIDSATFFSPERLAAPGNIVQVVPSVPILIDGTLYDPQDISRFDGQELHFIATPGGDHLLAISDRAVMSKWWEGTFLSSLASRPPLEALALLSPQLAAAQYMTRSTDFPATVVYYSDINYGGWSISHPPNRGYANLTQHHMGVFGWGSAWNDKISSVSGQKVRLSVLYEHINWGGQTFTLWSYTPSSPEGPVPHAIIDARNLHPWGWGDRASSVAGW